MFKPADEIGLKRRLAAVVVLLAGLAAVAALSSAGATFPDTQAALAAGALMLLLIVLATGTRIRVTWAHAAVAVLILAFLAASFTSIWRVESLIRVGLLVGYGAVFLTAANLAGGNRLRLAAHLLTLVGTIVAVWGIYGYLVGFGTQITELTAAGHADQARQLASMAHRAFANFASANSFAGFLILIIPITVGLLIYERDIRLRVWPALALAAMSAALYFTFSKGALMALAAAGAVLLFSVLRRSPKTRSTALVLPAALLIVVSLYVFWRFYQGNIAGIVANTAGRVDLWRGAWHIWLEHPWLGVGPGAFATEFTRYQSSSVFSPHAHNTYLQIAAESGTIGLAAFLVAMGSLIGVGRRRVNAAAGDYWLRLGLLASLVGFLAHNVVDYTWYVPGVAFSFWLVAGLATAPADQAPVVGAEPSRSRYLLTGLTAVLLVPILLVYAGAGYAAIGAELRDGFKLAKAEQFFRLSLRLFPLNAEAHDGLAQTLYLKVLVDKAKTVPGAIDSERTAIGLRPTWPFYHARLADYLAASGQDKSALREYQRAIVLYPLDAKIRVKAGNYLLKKRDYRQARAMFRSATRLGRVYREDLYTAAGLASARQDVSAPLTAIAYAHIGEMKAELALGRYGAASAALYKAEVLLGRTADIYYLRGQIFEGRGSYKAAAKAYRSATAKMTIVNPDVYYHLANALVKSGQRQDAVRELRKVLKVDPGYQPAKRLLRRLEVRPKSGQAGQN